MPEKAKQGPSVLNLINSPSRRAREDKKSTKKYKLFVGTWNVGGIPPSDDINLEEWLDVKSGCYHDIYVLGFQEIVPLTARNVLGPEKRKVQDKWSSLISMALNNKSSSELKDKNKDSSKGGGDQKKQKVHPLRELEQGSSSNEEEEEEEDPAVRKFQCLASKQMVGLFLSVWIRSDLHSHTNRPSISCVGCGVMGVLGNKGSVSIRFELHRTSFCFVCCHLASGGKEGDGVKRNSDAVEILSRTNFPPSQKISSHEISLPEALTSSLVEQKQCTILLQNDQLRAEAAENKVFQGWQEGDINFFPTYKYCPNSDTYFVCTNPPHKRRAPAWCDRIIWHGEGIKQERYGRCEMTLSDHRPVRGVFIVDVDVPTSSN